MTTIVSVRYNNKCVIAGDGQVSLGNTVMKDNAKKVRFLANGKVLSGFAGSTADAFTLFERLEARLEKNSNQLLRSCVDLAKEWRTDKYLRRLEAMMIVADNANTYILSGNGDVVEPSSGVVAIGSGGNYALAAAKALLTKADQNTSAKQIAEQSLNIAADICVFTNHNLVIEEI
jgi:ATP-dependent HslUV protease subunit HslV